MGKPLFLESMLGDHKESQLIPKGLRLLNLKQMGKLDQKRESPEIIAIIQELKGAGFKKIITLNGSIEL